MNEIWKDIKGFEGYYQVSDQGRVKQLARHFYSGNRWYDTPERILEPFIWQSPYLRVELNYMRDGIRKRKATYVHTLVAEAFIGDRPKGLVIDHINRNYLDNRACNLRYVTQSENLENSDNETRIMKVTKKLNENKPCKGRIYVSLNNESKMVKQEELQQYIDNGWHLGFDKCKHKKRITKSTKNCKYEIGYDGKKHRVYAA